MKNYHALLVWLRLFVCFFAALHININYRWDLINKAIVNPRFYVAFVISFGISYLLLWLVHTTNKYLNKSYPWHQNRLIRPLLQFVFGVIIPSSVDAGLICIYFLSIQLPERIPKFWVIDFPTVVLFLIAINVVYITLEFFSSYLMLKKIEQDRIFIRYNGTDILLNIATDILYIYKDQKKIKIVTISGHEYSTKGSIKKIIQIYSNSSLCQINQSVIVNLEMLKGHNNGTKSKTLDLLFKPQFCHVISERKFEKLYVTRDFIQGFKADLEKNVAGSGKI